MTLDIFNSWLDAYFERFHSQLPIIHLPTLDLNTADPYLLASIAVVGGCYVDPVRSSPGPLIILMERLRIRLNVHEGETQFAHLYASLLLIIASLFCGNRKTYEMAETDRAVLIATCRKESLFDAASLLRAFQFRQDDNPDSRWRQWVYLEQRIRLGSAVLIIDNLFPALFDLPPCHSLSDTLGMVLPCEARFWEADAALSWEGLLGLSLIPPSRMLKDS